jgi:hypothetical protein
MQTLLSEVANRACVYCEREIDDGLFGLSVACHDCRHPLHGSWVPPSWWSAAEEEDATVEPPPENTAASS